MRSLSFTIKLLTVYIFTICELSPMRNKISAVLLGMYCLGKSVRATFDFQILLDQ